MAPRDRNQPKRSASSKGLYTLADVEREFPDDATCLAYLWKQNYSTDGEHAHCPKCGEVRKFHRDAKRPSYSCDVCGLHLHPTAGTIFHKSSTGLDLWFKAIFLMSSTRCGISAKELERQLGVTYKTAWRMANLIRHQLMEQGDEQLTGAVEADETYIGGRPKATDTRTMAEHRARKVVVFGAVERGGKLRALVIPNNGFRTLTGVVRRFVLPTATLYTDEYKGYTRVGREYAGHRTVRHGSAIYVSGDATTNRIEGFFGNLKPSLTGTYRSVSRKWLQGYLNEFVWRYNHRDDTEPTFRTLLAASCRKASLAAS
jgi:transposase-like protein